MFSLKQFAGLGTPVGQVTLTGATIEHQIPGPTGGATARLEFRQDGTVWKTEGETETQLSAGTDWIDPKMGMLIHKIRFTNLAGDDPSASTAAEDVWHSMRDGEFFVQYRRITSGFVSGTFDIEIALDTSNPRGSGEYSMRAEKA